MQTLPRLENFEIDVSRATGWDRPHGEPDAFLSEREGHGWLVKLWPGDSLQPQLFDYGSVVGERDDTISVEDLVEAISAWRAEKLNDNEEVRGLPDLLVLAPSLEDKVYQTGCRLEIDNHSVLIIGRRACAKAERIAEAIRANQPACPDNFDAEMLKQWRAIVVPEVRIDAPAYIERKRKTPTHFESAAPLLLDYNQERCARLDLEGIIDLRERASDFQTRLVTGVAGCGKTLLLLHRAALLMQHFPNARVLLVSHNRPLIADLERKLQR
ncbi:MAG: hypothetical protein AAF357_01065, partial [Verrucomicrobiota bacterium]